MSVIAILLSSACNKPVYAEQLALCIFCGRYLLATSGTAAQGNCSMLADISSNNTWLLLLPDYRV